VTTPSNELETLLSNVAAERLAILERHEAGARVVGDYDDNNTYQYIISREETHLQWLQTALEESGATLPAPSAAIPVPAVTKGRKGGPPASRGVIEDDASRLAEFVRVWRPRIETVSHARHRLMLGVIIGESLEHQRLLAQAAAGMEDVLGRRLAGATRVGQVLPSRWQE
jgi:hypothetical protein